MFYRTWGNGAKEDPKMLKKQGSKGNRDARTGVSKSTKKRTAPEFQKCNFRKGNAVFVDTKMWGAKLIRL